MLSTGKFTTLVAILVLGDLTSDDVVRGNRGGRSCGFVDLRWEPCKGDLYLPFGPSTFQDRPAPRHTTRSSEAFVNI